MRTLILFITVIALNVVVNAQQDSTVQQDSIATEDPSALSMTVVDGETLLANSQEQHVQLCDLVITVNKLKRLRSEGRLTKEGYDSKVAILIGTYKK